MEVDEGLKGSTETTTALNKTELTLENCNNKQEKGCYLVDDVVVVVGLVVGEHLKPLAQQQTPADGGGRGTKSTKRGFVDVKIEDILVVASEKNLRTQFAASRDEHD